MNKRGDRIVYSMVIVIVMCLGLLSRKFTDYIPEIINLFLGDLLWALMIYFFIRLIFRNSPIKKVTLISILFCFSIEVSQLYHSQWIDTIRGTTLGGLVLGYGFLWSDLLAYLLGIGLGTIADKFIKKYTVMALIKAVK